MKKLLFLALATALLPISASAISTGAIRAVEVNNNTSQRENAFQRERREQLEDEITSLEIQMAGHENAIREIRAVKSRLIEASLQNMGQALEMIGADKSLAGHPDQANAVLAQKLLEMEQDLTRAQQYLKEAKDDYATTVVARDRLNIPLMALETMPGVTTQGEDGKLSPKLSVTSWDGKDFGKDDRWHYGYGVNVDIQAAKVSSTPSKAADEFLLSGGDGNIDLSFAVGYRLGSRADLSFWLGGTQSWLDTNLEEGGQIINVDDDIRRYRTGILLQTRYFYIAGEWIKNEYSGKPSSEFGNLVDGESGLKLSFITRLDKDFYLRYDSLEADTGNQSAVTITKNLSLF